MKTESNDLLILKFVIECIDNDTVDLYFNEMTLEYPNVYQFPRFGWMITKEMVDDIISDPEHYRKFIK